MGECKHHPQNLSPGDSGFCSSCLQKKLNSVWRGESTRSDVADHPDSSLQQKEAIAVVGSIASITKPKHSSKRAKGRDISEVATDFLLVSRYTDGITSFRSQPVHHPSNPIQSDHARSTLDMKDWTKRRSKVSSLVSKRALPDAKSGITSTAFSGARSVGCRSLPLVDRIAKETALRVIKEVGDDMSEGDGIVLEARKEQDARLTCFSPARWRSKWGLKGLGSPMTSSNKIFPSRSVENVQRSLQAQVGPLREDSRFVCAGDVDRQRRTLQQAGEVKPSLQVKGSGHESELTDSIVIEGMPDRILKPEDMNQRLRTSHNTVLQWLQVTRFFHFCEEAIFEALD